MQQTTLNKIKAGEYFKRKPDAAGVYIRGEYCREARKYFCNKADDIWSNGALFKGSTIVYIGFTY